MIQLNIFATVAISSSPSHPIPQNSLQDQPRSFISIESSHLKPVNPFNVTIISIIRVCAPEDTQLLYWSHENIHGQTSCTSASCHTSAVDRLSCVPFKRSVALFTKKLVLVTFTSDNWFRLANRFGRSKTLKHHHPDSLGFTHSPRHPSNLFITMYGLSPKQTEYSQQKSKHLNCIKMETHDIYKQAMDNTNQSCCTVSKIISCYYIHFSNIIQFFICFRHCTHK
jgi:hypothetical protein